MAGILGPGPVNPGRLLGERVGGADGKGPRPNKVNVRAAGVARVFGAPHGAAGRAAPKNPAPARGRTGAPASNRQPRGGAGHPHPKGVNPYRGMTRQERDEAEVTSRFERAGKKVLAGERGAWSQEEGRRGNEERSAAGKLGEYQKSSSEFMAEQARNQEASAKTFENSAAEAALNAKKSIETSGQHQEEQAGGRLGAQFQQSVSAGKNLVGAIGTAGEQATIGRAQSNNNFLSQIRENAVARFNQSNENLRNTYAREREKAQESHERAESSYLSRMKEQAVSEGARLGQSKYAEELKAAELGPKTAALTARAEQGRAAAKKSASEVGLGREKLRAGEHKNAESQRDQERKLGIDERNAATSERRAESYAKKRGGSASEVKEHRRFANELQTAFNYWNKWGAEGQLKTNQQMKEHEEALKLGYHLQKVGATTKTQKLSYPHVRGVIIEAAREFHYKGHLTRQTQRELEATVGWRGTSQQMKREILGG